MTLPIVVAIPVCNEECHLPACLDSLSAQFRPADRIVLLLNNCTDASLEICQQAKRASPAIQIVECQLHGHEASAGEARRLAFENALAVAGDAVILTTDADTVVPPHWIADNLAEIANGADCVCGMAKIEPVAGGACRARVEFDDMREALLLQLQDEIACIADPDASDPWPRHQQNSGASIAVTACILRKAGGAPRVASGEDRALVSCLALVDAKIRHAPQIEVTVSGRLQGRAAGGMAETIARRLQRQDLATDEILEPTVDAYRRALARARLRAIRCGGISSADFEADLLLCRQVMRSALRTPYFGTAWARIQQASPVLQRRRVSYLDLARETRQALALRDHLNTVTVRAAPAAGVETMRHAI